MRRQTICIEIDKDGRITSTGEMGTKLMKPLNSMLRMDGDGGCDNNNCKCSGGGGFSNTGSCAG